jgi:hypothetical protein
MRAIVLVLAFALAPGCTMFHPCPAGQDCSYVFTGVMATVTFPEPWNATTGEAGARAAGFSDVKPADMRTPEGDWSSVMAMQPGMPMPQLVAGVYPGGGSALTLYFHRAPGDRESHAQTMADANATWPSLRAQADAALARYENATGWRHAGAWNVSAIEGIT